MKDNLENNLKKFCLQSGVSGYEKESGISGLLFQIVKNINPKTRIDSAGNILSEVGSGKRTMILEAHMDEIGFLVSGIKNNNILLSRQGIIKKDKVANSKVFVVNKNVKGEVIIDKRNNFVFIPDAKNDFVKIKQKDVIAFKRSFAISRKIIKASSLDNRIGCAVLLEVLKKSIRSDIKNKLLFVFSTKEEINQSSFKDIVKGINDSFAIVVDAAYAQPCVEFCANTLKFSIPIIGNGCAVQKKGKGFNIPKDIVLKVKKIARDNNIKLQEEIVPNGFGKTNFAQMMKHGIKKGIVINIPVRDQHCQRATANISDAEEAVSLLLRIIEYYA